jgi:hypothetical protein
MDIFSLLSFTVTIALLLIFLIVDKLWLTAGSVQEPAVVNVLVEEYVRWLDSVIIGGRLHDDPWVSQYWRCLTPHEKRRWLSRRSAEFRPIYDMFSQEEHASPSTIIAMVEMILDSTATGSTLDRPVSAPVTRTDVLASGTIIVSRNEWQGKLLSYDVILNEQYVGDVNSKGRIVVPASLGEHTLEVRSAIKRSKTYKFTLKEDGQTKRFFCRTARSFLKIEELFA